MKTGTLRPRVSHFHPECSHWCFRYGCFNRYGLLVRPKCGECTTKEFNARMAARESRSD